MRFWSFGPFVWLHDTPTRVEALRALLRETK